jgi:hypothetical protein
MKTFKFKSLIALIITTFFSCSNFDDLNVDPNSATSVDPSNLVSYAQFKLYDYSHGRDMNMEHGKLMVQHYAQNEYAEESRYQYGEASIDDIWFVLYAEVLKELETAKELVNEQDLPEDIKSNKKAIIDILKVNAFMLLTDSFGDIPYTEALKNDIPLPNYDSQETVYTGMLSTLSSAASSLDTKAISFSSGDIIYNGNVGKWKKFAHSLMLRLAIRVSDAAPSTATKYAATAVTDLITSLDEEPRFTFDSAPDRSNPMWRDKVQDSRDDFAITELLVKELNDRNDPRLAAFADEVPGGGIVGMPYGLDDNSASSLKSSTSRPHAKLLEATAHHVILSLSEVKFLLAEAYQRGILTGNAEAAYKEGITSSMNYWGITDADAINDYLNTQPYDPSNWKASIGTQKWISLYTSGTEAWAEWRRLDQPNLKPSANGVVSSIPTKMPYPQSERSNNASSLSDVSNKPTNITVKVWWDKN